MAKGYTKEERKKIKNERLGVANFNYQNSLMKVVIYNNSKDIIVEFQDDGKARVHTSWSWFEKGVVENPFVRLGEERLNNQGSLMKIVEYKNSSDMVVEFQDDYRAKVNTQYSHFSRGQIKNPYHPSICGVGMIGEKYPISVNSKHTKEYNAWVGIIERCYSEKWKMKRPTYENVTCCKEWLLYENFYEWLHSQPNFEKWYNGKRWAIDKDILNKGNKVYSPETCCLVSLGVNSLFTKCDKIRGDLPIGVSRDGKKFRAYCTNPFTKEFEYLGKFDTSEKAFYLGYKPRKEIIIKQVAEFEYNEGNISKECYDTMMNYIVEITD